jgi:hypothetical protein
MTMNMQPKAIQPAASEPRLHILFLDMGMTTHQQSPVKQPGGMWVAFHMNLAAHRTIPEPPAAAQTTLQLMQHNRVRKSRMANSVQLYIVQHIKTTSTLTLTYATHTHMPPPTLPPLVPTSTHNKNVKHTKYHATV